jgi:WbqC-like protein family
MTLIIDLQYFPSFILYKSLYNFSNIVFEQYEGYQKMSFRNRCQIVGAEGVIDLSIPLVRGRDQKALMRDVRISAAQPWQSRHWKTIVSCYNRSPWFEYYRDELEGLYRKPCEFLVDWNLMCFEWTVKVLGISTPVSLTGGYEKGYAPDQVTDWRGKILPKHRAEGMAGLSAIGLSDEGARVPLDAQVRPYRQVFEERIGFIPNLSVLDLLFCEGKQAVRYLQSF